MVIGSAFANGLQGYQRAERAITQETANIAEKTARTADQQVQNQQQVQAQRQTTAQQAPQPPEQSQPANQQRSLETSVVGLTAQLSNAQSNVRSIETANEVVGSLIDVRV